MHLELGDILFDYSKNIVTDRTLSLFLQLADECRVKDAIAAMFNGDIINETEHRSVLHIALRNFSKEPVYAQGDNVMPGVKKVLRKMKTFCDAVHAGGAPGLYRQTNKIYCQYWYWRQRPGTIDGNGSLEAI